MASLNGFNSPLLHTINLNGELHICQGHMVFQYLLYGEDKPDITYLSFFLFSFVSFFLLSVRLVLLTSFFSGIELRI